MFKSILLLLHYFHLTVSLNILMYVPTLSYSHVSFNGKIAEKLVSSGHQVTMVLGIVDDDVHYNNSKFEVIPLWLGVPSGQLRRSLWQNPGPFEDASPLNPRIFTKLIRVSNLFVRACEELSQNKFFIRQMRQRNFDVGMVEQYDSCGFGLFEKISVRNVVWLSATAVFRPQPAALGVDHPLSYVPELFSNVKTPISFVDRIQNILVAAVTEWVFSVGRRRQSEAFGSDLFSLSESADSVLINSAPFFDDVMPTSHQITNVGGVSVSDESPPLTEIWKTVADFSSNGFVLVTFGSIAKTIDMPREMQMKFLKAFSKLPHITFIVKYETENATIPLPSNVITTQWIPQTQLMAHPNYKGIVTHGGLSSVFESLLHHRPMVLMPLFADHFKNANVVQSKKVGIVLDKNYLTVEEIADAIKTILEDNRFSANCVKMSAMLRSSAPISHSETLDYRIRSAVRKSRKKFRLRPKKPNTLLGLPETFSAIVVVLSIGLVYC